MVAALKAKGLRVAYRAFEGEGHGFRRRETLEAALQAELAFYAEVFGFTPATVPGEATAEVPWV
jgi:dipeptidyl aminopeptidase/acylaminoacyl peptidase